MQYEERPVYDFQAGDGIEGFYIISNTAVKTASNGKTFLSCTIADRTGAIDAKLWDYTGNLTDKDAGIVVKIRAEVTEYKGALQLKILRLRLPEEKDEGKYHIEDLVPTAPIDAEKTLADVRALLASIEDPDYRAVAEEMLSKHLAAFTTIPAAKSMHHSFLRGLLMHTTDMLRLADFLAYQYSDVINRSLLLAGTFLHDFSKEQEFTFSALGLVTDYSVKGQLLGHLVMGAQEVAELCRSLSVPEEKSLLLQHLILSHHGEPEFGAAVLPAVPRLSFSATSTGWTAAWKSTVRLLRTSPPENSAARSSPLTASAFTATNKTFQTNIPLCRGTGGYFYIIAMRAALVSIMPWNRKAVSNAPYRRFCSAFFRYSPRGANTAYISATLISCCTVPE